MTTDTRRFEGYGVLITGAARGIGAATALRFAEEGARVLVADVDDAEAGRTASALRERPVGRGHHLRRGGPHVGRSGCRPCRGRLRVARRPGQQRRPLHTGRPLFEDQPDEAWARDLDVTLTGAHRCCRAALPHLAASGRGAIVAIGSVNGIQDFGNHGYSAAKAGLASLTRTLAGHAGPRGVRVNLVAPGTVRTRAWEGRADGLAALAAVRGLYPLGRVGEPEDIAAAVAFLASCDASWITGTTLVVDGGVTAVNAGFRQALAGPES